MFLTFTKCSQQTDFKFLTCQRSNPTAPMSSYLYRLESGVYSGLSISGSHFLNSHCGIRVYNRIISTCSDALLYMRRDLFVLLERTIHQFDNGCTRTINAIHSVMASVDIPDHHSPKQTANNQNLSSRV